jgi:hypothetical protein
MKSHLIDDLVKFGVWDDDYGSFVEQRAKRISDELKKRVIEQEIDSQGQKTKFDDLEETEEDQEAA